VTIPAPTAIFPPGDVLRDELNARGWTQVELAEILGRPPRVVSEIISAKRSISPETAKGFAAAFGTSAEMWMNLETLYQLSKAQFESSLIAHRAKLYGKFPVKEMLRRGWVEFSKDPAELEEHFLSFFGIQTLEEEPIFYHAAKKTHYQNQSGMLQLAWLNRAKQIARANKPGNFSVMALKTAVNELKDCLDNLAEVKNASDILAKAGVCFIIIEHLPGAKIDGACFWLDKSSPVIVLSLRFDRIDNFWHTLFHEIDHILHEEGKDEPILDVFDGDSIASKEGLPPIEIRANKAAAEYCVSGKELESWVASTSRVSSKRQIVSFANRMRVHPGIIVGQLQRRGIIPYSFHRNLLEKVRHFVSDSAITDGFGKKIEL